MVRNKAFLALLGIHWLLTDRKPWATFSPRYTWCNHDGDGLGGVYLAVSCATGGSTWLSHVPLATGRHRRQRGPSGADSVTPQ